MTMGFDQRRSTEWFDRMTGEAVDRDSGARIGRKRARRLRGPAFDGGCGAQFPREAGVQSVPGHQGATYQRRATRAAGSVGKRASSPSSGMHLAATSVSLTSVRAESSTPRGPGAGDPMQLRGCGGESPQSVA